MAGFSFRRLNLESLTERINPATLNLTSAGATVTSAGAIFQQANPAQIGTGLDNFLRIDNNGVEQGYNTNNRPLQFDAIGNKKTTHALKLADVPLVSIDGGAFREFVLDVRQKANSPMLSIDEIRIFSGSNANMNGFNNNNNKLAGQTAIWNMDSSGNNTIRIDDNVNPGTGAGDMLMFVPESAFAGLNPNSFIFLYSKMGGLANSKANGGAETWAVRGTEVDPPPPPSGPGSIAGRVFVDVDQDGIFEGEGFGDDFAIFDATITLEGTDNLGNPVFLTAQTDLEGKYYFTNLNAGNYTLTETQPFDTLDGTDWVGSAGGTAGNDIFSGILLGADVDAINYNFTELSMNS